MSILKSLALGFVHALQNLLPIIVVVALFQGLVFVSWPDNFASLFWGMLVVAVGIALFLQGLEYSIFPLGRSLANQFARRGSLFWLLSFSFCLGFAAVIAEPALIAIADQAMHISEGRINALTLRLLVATSVGLVLALGVLRILLGHNIIWYMVIGYTVVIVVTFFSPAEIVGLAYDSGGVTTNIVTVPLVAALGVGLASSIAGRNPLIDGFGLVAMAVMMPMVVVQLYGIWVYAVNPSEAMPLIQAAADALPLPWWQRELAQLLSLVRDLVPIMLVVVLFQFLVLRKPLSNPGMISFGFLLVLLGLYAFVLGLKLGLFPLGKMMAEQLLATEQYWLLYLFAFAIGLATTLAEPALIAVGRQAQKVAPGLLNAQVIRWLVAVGVAIGLTVGVHRLLTGHSLHVYIIGCYLVVLLLTLLCPKYLIALAFDLGGVTTSEVTVPLVTALGLGLAAAIPGRSVLIDGFGLIAFASIFPIVSVLLYGLIMEQWQKRTKGAV